MYTPLQLSMKLKVERHAIYYTIKKLELEPIKQVGTSRYYDINDFYEVRNRNHKSIWLGKEKILILDYWIKMRNHKSVTEISLELGIEYDRLIKCIREFKNNDNCITIKSKLC